MKRLNLLLLAVVLTLSGLASAPARSDNDVYNQGTPLAEDKCLASPFGRYIDGPTQDSYSILLAQPNGGPLLSDVGKAASSSLMSDGPDSFAVDTTPSYGGQAAAQLAGDGYESLVTVAGRSGYEPMLVTQRRIASGAMPRTELRLPDPAVGAAVASGRFLGASSVQSWQANGYVTEPEQVVVATRLPWPGYTLRLYKSPDSGFTLEASSAVRSWAASQSPIQDPSWEDLQVARVDIDGDRKDEIAVLYRAASSLTIDLLRVTAAGTGFTKLSTYYVDLGSQYSVVKHVKLVSGFFGDAYRPELAVAYVVNAASGGYDTAHLRTIGFDPAGAMRQTGARTFQVQPTANAFPNFALGAADTSVDAPADGGNLEDHVAPDELVFARIYNGVKVDTIDTQSETLATHNSYTESAAYVSGGAYAPYGLGLGAGDINLDGSADIVLTFLNGGISHVVWLKDRKSQGQGLIRSYGRKGYYTLDGLTNLRPLSVTMVDKANKAIRLTLQSTANHAACRDYLHDDRVMTASDSAPFWKSLSPAGKDYGSTNIALGRGDEGGTERGFIRHFGIEASVTLGVGGDWEPPILGSLFGEVEEKFLRSLGYSFDYNWGHSDASTSSSWSSSGWWNDGDGTEVQTYRTPYRCYNYADATGAIATKACHPLPPTATDPPAMAQWDEEKWEKIGLTESTDAWVPVRAPWTNRALLLPAANATQSGGGSSAALAIDGDTDATHFGTTARTVATANPYWQVKLAESEKLGLVRIWQGGGIDCAMISACDELLRDVNVYVFDDPTLANAPSSELQARAQAGEAVFIRHLPGTVGDVLSVVTRTPETHEPVSGRYVRVERQTGATPAVLSLTEVEVYASDTYQAPPEYPRDVEYVTPHTMRVELWDPARGEYVWKTVRGQLVDLPPTVTLYDRSDPETEQAAPAWYQVNEGCGAYSAWEYRRSESTTHRSMESFAHDWSTGGEFDFEGKAAGAEVIFEAKLDDSLGFVKESSSSHTTGSDFSLTGWRQNYCAPEEQFPDQKEADMSDHCVYRYRPFYYAQEESSDFGRRSTFIHVSYIVDMNRSADLRNCWDGHWRKFDNVAPTVSDVEVGTGVGQAATIDIRAYAGDLNPEDTSDYLRVEGVSSIVDPNWKSQVATPSGSVAVVDDQLVYTPALGFRGSDTFFVVLTDGDKLSQPSRVTVVVAGPLEDGACESPGAWTATGLAAVEEGACKVRVSPSGAGSVLSQTFLVPESGSHELSVSHVKVGSESPAGDELEIRLKPAGSSAVTLETFGNEDPVASETSLFDLSGYAGQVVTLTFEASGAADGVPTEWRIDNLSMS